MSIIQLQDLVSYHLRAAYLTEVSDGVGERLITLQDNFFNSAPYKATGWRADSTLIRRTHSPPIPTVVASEYFQAPPGYGRTLEDEADDGSLRAQGGFGGEMAGRSLAATKRRRRREHMTEEDSSDASDESDEEPEQRPTGVQQIKFTKMPVRTRSGSSPVQLSHLRPPPTTSPRATPRRGSHSALETVKERARRGTMTSVEFSSENEVEASLSQRQADGISRPAARAGKLAQSRPGEEQPIPIAGTMKRTDSGLLAEEEDSDATDLSSAFGESIDSASILEAVDITTNASPGQQVVGTPPREFLRRSTVRRSAVPAPLKTVELPPPRPLSMVRPVSMMQQPVSLLSAALAAQRTKPYVPFHRFASLSGQGDPNPIMLRIFAPFSRNPPKPFEVTIRRTVHDESGGSDRPVTVEDLVGLSLWRYSEEKREPPLATDKLNINWYSLRMVEEDGEVDDDFPAFERKKQLLSITSANSRGGRGRSNSKVYDNFALVQASPSAFAEYQRISPQRDEEVVPTTQTSDAKAAAPEEAASSKNVSSPVKASPLAARTANPITTTYRSNGLLADVPQPQPSSSTTTTGHRGTHKILRIRMLVLSPPGQLVTLDVTTDTYLAEVLDTVCKRRHLDKAAHVLRLPGGGPVALLDRTVSSIGNVADLELCQRRFATDGPLTLAGSPSSSSPKPLYGDSLPGKKKGKIMGAHPLAQEAMNLDELGGGGNYKKYVVWRKQPMRFVSGNERLLTIDGEYIHITPPASGGKVLGGSKSTTVHFSNVIGCKVSRKHPTHIKLVVYKATECKRYDFEAKNAEEAAEIVVNLSKGISPYRQR